MTIRKTFALITALTVGGIATAGAQQPTAAPKAAVKNASVATATQGQTKRVAAAARAAVSSDSARALVMTRSPGATIVSSKLRRRGGRLMYDVKVRDQGQKASHWLRVDANTGVVTEAPMSGKGHKRS